MVPAGTWWGWCRPQCLLLRRLAYLPSPEDALSWSEFPFDQVIFYLK